MGDGALRSVAEQLKRSTGGIVLVTPDPRPSPDGWASDGVIQFVDHHDVIYNSKGDDKKEEEIRNWIMEKIADYLKGYFQTIRGCGLLIKLQERIVQPDQILDEDNLEIRLADENPTYVSPRKFWFWIEPVVTKPNP